MTRNEFINYWCANSGITAEDLKLHGLIALPCDCDDSSCRGWQMAGILLYQLDSEALNVLPQEYQDEIKAMVGANGSTNYIGGKTCTGETSARCTVSKSTTGRQQGEMALVVRQSE